MALAVGSSGTSNTTTTSAAALKVAASRSHASPLASTQRLTLGGSGSSYGQIQCLCIGCQPATASTGSSRQAAPIVDYTDTIKRSGKRHIDALLAGGNRWFHAAGTSGEVPSASARTTLSYSFIEDTNGLQSMDANGFAAMSTQQRNRVREVFDYLETLVNVQFSEVASGGDLSFGTNSQTGSAGYARYPNEGSQIFMANNQASTTGDWQSGSYGYMTLLHETAHALGLKHPGNYNAGGGGTPGPYLSGSADNRGNTIMSYRDANNLTRIAYNNGSFSKSQVVANSYQGYDIAALQYLYGGSQTVQAQNYAVGHGNPFSATLWNPNAGSAVDASLSSTSNLIDLRAGRKSSIGIVDPYGEMPFTKAEYAALKSNGRTLTSLIGKPSYTGQNNLTLAEGSNFTVAKGGSAADKLVANANGGTLDGGGGDDQLFWTGGNMSAVGGSGADVLHLKKVRGAVWAVAQDGSAATLTRTERGTGVVTTLATLSLSGIEAVRYWNGSSLKASGAALYTAV